MVVVEVVGVLAMTVVVAVVVGLMVVGGRSSSGIGCGGSGRVRDINWQWNLYM